MHRRPCRQVLEGFAAEERNIIVETGLIDRLMRCTSWSIARARRIIARLPRKMAGATWFRYCVTTTAPHGTQH